MKSSLPLAPPLPAQPIAPVPRDGDRGKPARLPLSYAQRGLWFLHQLAPASAVYNIPSPFLISGRLDLRLLEWAFAEVLRRHEVLRTSFEVSEGEPFQLLHPAPFLRLAEVDLRALTPAARAEQVEGWTARETERPFDLVAGPPWRALILTCSPEEHVLLLVLHHIVFDGWSEQLLLRELAELYESRVDSRPSALPELSIQYADFASWQRASPRASMESRLAYWREHLAGAPEVLELPTDHPRPMAQSFRGSDRRLTLPATVASELRLAARREGVTLYMLALAAFQGLLARYTGQEDILVGTPLANRMRPETKGLIGLFIDTLVLRGKLGGEPDYRRLLRAARADVMAAFLHQGLPFEMLVEELRPKRDPARNPLVQVLLNFAGAEASKPAAGGGLCFTPLPLGRSTTAKLDLNLVLQEKDDALELRLEYATDLFDATTVLRLLEHYATLLGSAVTSPELPLSRLPLTSAAESHQALVEWNDTASRPPEDGLFVHQLVASRARQFPAALAVIGGGGGPLSYGELERRARRIARTLHEWGVGPEVRVGVGLERSPELVIAVLAVFQAGGAYVALDPSLPEERLSFQLADAGVPVLLTHRGRLAELATSQGVLCLFPHEMGEDGAGDLTFPAPALHADNLAYVIYTSGSTGRPKGVELSHGSLLNLLAWHAQAFQVTEDDRATLLAGVGFDASVWETWPYLTSGASLSILPEALRTSPEGLRDWMLEQGITATWLPVPLAEAVLDLSWRVAGTAPRLRYLLTGSDRLHRRPPVGLPFPLYNTYGPTESTVISTAGGVPAVDLQGLRSAPTLGRPLANTRLHVVELRGGELRPVPRGVPGELLIGGAGLARGYLRRPDLTAERFVPDPFGAEPGSRLYRTGDLVRWRSDGEIDFLGRVDQQVKIRGYRIEPGEVEAVLGRHPAVRDVAVLALNGNLVAFVSARQGLALDLTELRELARRRLADYMVPVAFVPLAALPLNASSKVDRRALAGLEWQAASGDGQESGGPRTPVEELLVGLWEEVLGRSPIQVDDDFFHLGGHSLLGTRLLSRIREILGIDLPVRTLFEAPTVNALARAVTAARRGAEDVVPMPLEPVLRGGFLPLSFAQQRLWFLDRLAPGSATYNIPSALALRGRLEPAALAASLAGIVHRHEVLRTRFVEVGGEPFQEILEPPVFLLSRVDLGGLRLPGAELSRLATEEARRPFDLARGPLLRTSLVRLGREEHVLLLTLHHIVADGWSDGILRGELATLYTAALAGKPSPLAALRVQYADFAVWQRAWPPEVMARQLAYWKEQLAGAPVALPLPTDRPRPAVQSFRGGGEERLLPAALGARLRAAARREGTTLYMLLLAGFAALLARYSGEEDLLIGMPVANRTRPEIEGLIGFFVNTLALRVELSGDPDFRRLLGAVREAALSGFAHQDLPFEALVEELRPERDLARNPLIQVMLTLQSAGQMAISLPLAGDGLRSTPLRLGVNTTAKFDLSLAVEEEPGEREPALRLELQYARDLFARATAARLLEHYATLLDGAVAAPELALSRLPLISEAERHQAIVEWNDTASDFPRCTLYRLFEEQAAARPQAVAVVWEEGTLTYGELARRALGIALALRRLGVRREDRVGLCAERSGEMVAAVLGILAAGGAYLPLDPSYPRERLELLLRNAKPSAVVGSRLLLAGLPGTAPRLALEDLAPFEESAGAAPTPWQEGGPEGLAYVLYTSGSTGTPKGVEVSHQAVVRLVRDAGYAAFGPGEVFLQLAPMSFDAATLELWGPLLNGGRLVLFPPRAFSLVELYAAVERYAVTTLWLTAGLFHLAVEEGLEGLSGLRQLLAGGDALSRSHVERALAALPGVALINGYGPTENTTFSCCHPLSGGLGEGAVPIGRPIASSRAYVLDRALQPTPLGSTGEMYVGGAGLARAYLGRPDLTAERFVPDPFGTAGAAGGRLYRTGDFARWRQDGSLDFLGRRDFQVKIRGFRIELGEIESALLCHRGVRAAVVVALEEGAGDRRLAAFYVAGEGVEPSELRAFLSRQLPEHMVPATFLALAALPLMPNGKVDRRALTPLGEAFVAGGGEGGAVAPRTPVEEVLAGIWGEVLCPSRPLQIGVDDNFFELGGHSLLVTRVLSRIRTALGVDLSVRALFESATVSALARLVTAARQEAEEIGLASLALMASLEPMAPELRTGLLPLSFPQQRLWFLSRLAPDSAVYNIAPAFRLRGPLAPAALAASLAEILRRHEVLRTRFVEVDGEPWQEILPAGAFRLSLVDLRGLPGIRPELRETELTRWSHAEAARSFDLEAGPLLRATLIRLAVDEHALLLNVHHIAADGWSMGVLFSELSALYAAALAGRSSPLPEPGLQYADFAAWQRAWPPEVLARQLAYWKGRLAGTATLEIPTDRPRPPLQTFRGGVVTVTVPPVLTAALRGLARGRGVTLFMIVLAGWQALCHRLTGQADVAIGSPVANRTHRELEGLVGFFVNLLALRTDCGGDPSYARLLERVRQRALEAYDHADLPFERLVDELSLRRDLSRQPLVQVMFQLESLAPALALSGLEVARLNPAAAFAKFDLTLSLLDRGADLVGGLEYNADLFDRATVARLAGHLLHLLAAVTADPDVCLSGLDLLAPAERHELLREWNDTRASLPAATLQELFAAAVERSPEATAAVCAGREMTYAELAARAHRLAHLLRGQGLPRGGAVGVWMERSFDMLVAVLGILEAGGHYLPLDATWPAERVESILATTGARAILAGGGMLTAVEEMRWRLPALADTVSLAFATPEPPVERIEPEGVRALWDFVAERAVDRVTAGGFVSAFTGRPFAEAEVDEYRDRVLSLAAPWLRPDARVLEIGCGSGLLLWEIAPRVGRCVGVDPSPLTQERNRERLAAAGLAEGGRVELRTGFAHEIDGLLPIGERFDLILLASTVQFFPGPRYLERVVAAALERLAPGGALLVADVLDARRRGELQREIEAHRGPSAVGATAMLGAPGRGSELYLDEDLFRDLGVALPGAGGVSIHHRPQGFANELHFRYDVLLRACPGAGAVRRKRLWTAWHVDRQPAERLPEVASPDDLAYVIHTSGSTGEPKGIAVQHRPIANLIAWVNRTFEVGADDRVLFVTSLCFDLSVYDIFGVLTAGGTVHVATEEELADPDRLVSLLRSAGITLWDSAPAALARLAPLFPATPDPGSRLRRVLLSGDWIPVTLPDRVRRAFPAARVMALGGATEATVWSNWFPVGEVAPGWPSIPYGRPIANAHYHVLDAGLAPCPIGVPGDLYIGGDCLCSGYAGQPDLTALSFLPDPFAGRPGARLYRTGDRVRHLADGNLEFLGRLDQQVKVRGYRIELGEIEVALARCPGVREAVVLARPAGPAGEGALHDLRLVAYVVPTAGLAGSPSARDLREPLRRVLPEYMLPAVFVFLAALPVTANGKLDRKVLPEPSWEDGAGGGGTGGIGGIARAVVAPRTPLEERLASLWGEVLGIGGVGVHDNFFELGGHSLLATQLVARVRQALGVEMPLRTLFQQPALGDLAAAIAELQAEGGATERVARSPIVPIPRDGDLGLSYSQLRLWFLAQLEPESTAYNVPLTLRLRGPLERQSLARSLDEIARRHEALRTTFGVVAGQPASFIAPTATLVPALVDLIALPAGGRQAESRRLIQALGQHVFDLTRGPLCQVCLLRLRADEHFLLVTVHHIVFDGWSLGVFTGELAALYEAFLDGRPSPLPELEVQYADYAAWQRRWLAGEEGRRQVEYWRGQLEGATRVLDLPTDRPRPAVQTYRGDFEPLGIPGPLAEQVRALGLAQGATLFMALLAGLYALLQRYTRQDDFNVGTFVANRRWQSVEPLVGFFLNTLVLRANLALGPSFSDLLVRVRETTLGAYEHQDVPFEKLLEELERTRDLSRTPFFEVLFELQNFAAPTIRSPRLEVRPVNIYEPQRANFDLAFWLTESGEAVTGKLHYNRDLFERSTIRRLAGHLVNLLAAAVAEPDGRLAEFSLLTPAERHQVAGEWVDGGWQTVGRPPLVRRLIAAQAARNPDSAALEHGGEVLTYGELARRVARVARRLHGLGVGPESIVGICIRRCSEMVVGLLGILAAGAAYLPLDPDLPAERRSFLLADSRGAALLVAEPRPAGLASFAGPVLRLDEPWGDLEWDRAPLPEPNGNNLAYVLYTSGSTGKPKGVQGTQGSLAHFTLAALAAYGIGRSDRILQFASLSFDTSIEEIFPALVAGATVVLRNSTMMSSTAQFFATCGDWGITVLDLPTAYWHTLAADLPGNPGALPEAVRVVIMGGERPLPERVLGWLAAVGPHPRLLNSYGPTEATVAAAGGTLGRPGDPLVTTKVVPLGRPWCGARIWLLDPSLCPVPSGVVGEMHIAGPLARGYVGRPDLTAAAFIPCPFGGPGERLYRTGDLGRYRTDGTLEFSGRVDNQVKIRGFRIEPEEIAAVLSGQPAVREAVVVASEVASGERRLVAYFVAGREPVPGAGELRDFLKARLPAYMVPSDYVALAAIPLTTSGKLDAAALPRPEEQGESRYAPPQTEVEEMLIQIWEEMLHRERIGVDDNLFDLGGHSLLLPQLLSRIEQTLQLELPLRILFEAPTVAQLAVVVERAVLAQIEGLSDEEAASLLDGSPVATVSTSENA
jgi:amino acid adenylation domain-containing protein